MSTSGIEELGLSVPDAVRTSGVSRSKLYEALAAGELRAKKYGRRTIILRDELKAWLASFPDLTPSKSKAA
ncbi:helix-turn-helix domain-containing protein [Alsobacter sp. KACC 23698]|uniref:Helix-turn-helix domain-containing protein n=1 Tax=Alsobacter sp. KACC 23698 TaxID=3149229 RepID=A0AAU7JBT7_9HYPH